MNILYIHVFNKTLHCLKNVKTWIEFIFIIYVSQIHALRFVLDAI